MFDGLRDGGRRRSPRWRPLSSSEVRFVFRFPFRFTQEVDSVSDDLVAASLNLFVCPNASANRPLAVLQPPRYCNLVSFEEVCHAGWCAVPPDGYVYIPGRYSVSCLVVSESKTYAYLVGNLHGVLCQASDDTYGVHVASAVVGPFRRLDSSAHAELSAAFAEGSGSVKVSPSGSRSDPVGVALTGSGPGASCKRLEDVYDFSF